VLRPDSTLPEIKVAALIGRSMHFFTNPALRHNPRLRSVHLPWAKVPTQWGCATEVSGAHGLHTPETFKRPFSQSQWGRAVQNVMAVRRRLPTQPAACERMCGCVHRTEDVGATSNRTESTARDDDTAV
jgi:hypothetical protein